MPSSSSSSRGGSGGGGEVPGLLPPSPRSHLTGRQQQAVGNLLRVQALVEHFVAKHDEDRVTVRRRLPACLHGPRQHASAPTLPTYPAAFGAWMHVCLCVCVCVPSGVFVLCQPRQQPPPAGHARERLPS